MVKEAFGWQSLLIQRELGRERGCSEFEVTIQIGGSRGSDLSRRDG